MYVHTHIQTRILCEDTHRGEDHVKMEVEIGVMPPPTKEHPGLPKLDDRRTDRLLKSTEGM